MSFLSAGAMRAKRDLNNLCHALTPRGMGARSHHGKGEDDGGMGAGDVGMIMAGEVADISPASGGRGK